MDILQQKQFKILLIGDACTDVYVFGDCLRINPEAPVPIFTKSRKAYKDGMSANVHQNLTNIFKGEIFYLSNDKSKIKKIRFIDSKSNYQIMRYDVENYVPELNHSDLPKNDIGAIVISDYDKGFVSYDLIKKLKTSYSCPIFVDTKKSNLSLFEGCIIKLNEREHTDSFGMSPDTELIVTLGSKGVMWRDKIYPTDEVKVHDVCGAGDVFLASLVCRWFETNDLEKSIRLANKCASFSVTKQGTYHITRAEYENFCND